MIPYVIIFVVAYLAVLLMYFFSETSGNFKRRAINKIILASMFYVFGLIMLYLNYDLNSYHFIFLIALTFAYIGDIVLLYNFSSGGIFFIISNIFFFIYEWLLVLNNNVDFYKMFWFLILFILSYGTFVLLNITKKIKLNNKLVPIMLYLLSVSLHGTLGLVIAIYFHEVSLSLFGIGLFLFMISDYFLMMHQFKFNDKKWILRSNSATYFIGLLLVVLSLMF